MGWTQRCRGGANNGAVPTNWGGREGGGGRAPREWPRGRRRVGCPSRTPHTDTAPSPVRPSRPDVPSTPAHMTRPGCEAGQEAGIEPPNGQNHGSPNRPPRVAGSRTPATPPRPSSPTRVHEAHGTRVEVQPNRPKPPRAAGARRHEASNAITSLVTARPAGAPSAARPSHGTVGEQASRPPTTRSCPARPAHRAVRRSRSSARAPARPPGRRRRQVSA